MWGVVCNDNCVTVYEGYPNFLGAVDLEYMRADAKLLCCILGIAAAAACTDRDPECGSWAGEPSLLLTAHASARSKTMCSSAEFFFLCSQRKESANGIPDSCSTSAVLPVAERSALMPTRAAQHGPPRLNAREIHCS